MADSNNKNNLGLFAIIFTAIFGTLFGIFKIAEKASGDGPETAKMRHYIDTQLLEGVDDRTIANALMVEAMQQMGGNYSDKMTQMIRNTVSTEKASLKNEGKI